MLGSSKENRFQQISISDSFTGLTEREQKALEKSWAKKCLRMKYFQP